MKPLAFAAALLAGCGFSSRSPLVAGDGGDRRDAGPSGDGGPAGECSASRPCPGDRVCDLARGVCVRPDEDAGPAGNDGGPPPAVWPAFVMDHVAIARDGTGVDTNDDGFPDNSFAAFARFIGDGLDEAVRDGDYLVIVELRDVEDPAAQDDASMRVGLYDGVDSDRPPDPSDNFDGDEAFWGTGDSVLRSGNPATAIPGALAGGHLDARGDFTARLFMGIPLPLRRGRFIGDVAPDLGAIDEGYYGGVIPASLLSIAPAPFGGGTVLDLLATRIGLQPDIDMDGDNLELFRDYLDEEGRPGSDGRIDTCVDGDGAILEGGECIHDRRMADAYSVSFEYTAVRARFLGEEP